MNGPVPNIVLQIKQLLDYHLLLATNYLACSGTILSMPITVFFFPEWYLIREFQIFLQKK